MIQGAELVILTGTSWGLILQVADQAGDPIDLTPGTAELQVSGLDPFPGTLVDGQASWSFDGSEIEPGAYEARIVLFTSGEDTPAATLLISAVEYRPDGEWPQGDLTAEIDTLSGPRWAFTLSPSGGAAYEGSSAFGPAPSVIPNGSITTLKLADEAVTTPKLADQAVTFVKMQDLNHGVLLGRTSTGMGECEEILAANVPAMIGAASLSAANEFALLQSFVSGIKLLPQTAPVSPAEGEIWYKAGFGIYWKDSAGVRPLYEKGTWTPTLRPDAPGDFAATYSTQVGTYVKIGSLLFISLGLVTSAITWTSASGTMRILGLPFTMSSLSYDLTIFTMPTLNGLSLNTTAGIGAPMITPTAGGASTLVFRQFVRTTSAGGSYWGGLSIGSGIGFISGNTIQIQGTSLLGKVAEA